MAGAPTRSARAALGALVLAGLAAPPIAGADPAASAPERARAILARPGFQSELPVPPPAPREPPPDLGDRRRRIEPRERRELPAPVDLGPLGAVVRALGVALLVALGAFLAYVLVRAWARRARARDAAVTPATAAAAAGSLGDDAPDLAPALLGDADRLAAEGRFAEAIHALLGRTFAALIEQDLAPVGAGFTGRELLRRARLAAPPRQALGGLVDAVEQAVFGGRRVARADWEACRERYTAVAAACAAVRRPGAQAIPPSPPAEAAPPPVEAGP